jgi:hypothetical protein
LKQNIRAIPIVKIKSPAQSVISILDVDRGDSALTKPHLAEPSYITNPPEKDKLMPDWL